MKEKILIENGTIIDGTGSKEYIGNIIIEDNKIVAIGESAKDFSKEKDIKKIVASEKFVMPGILMHIVISALMNQPQMMSFFFTEDRL